MPGVGRVVIAGGWSVAVWDLNAQGTNLLFSHMAASRNESVTFQVTDRPAPKYAYSVANVTTAQHGSASYAVTTYSLAGSGGRSPAQPERVVVKEPLLPGRWVHSPMQLCCTLHKLDFTQGAVLYLTVDTQFHGGCLREFLLT